MKAKLDITLPISVISKTTVARLQLDYTQGQRETVDHSETKRYSLIGQLKLRWHRKDLALSHLETFHVTEMTACEVILGATASSEATDAIDSGIHTLGLDQQTTGMTQSSHLVRQYSFTFSNEMLIANVLA